MFIKRIVKYPLSSTVFGVRGSPRNIESVKFIEIFELSSSGEKNQISTRSLVDNECNFCKNPWSDYEVFTDEASEKRAIEN